jgi:hypothetical protein
MANIVVMGLVLSGWTVLGIIAGERIRGLAEVRKLHALAIKAAPPGPVPPAKQLENGPPTAP